MIHTRRPLRAILLGVSLFAMAAPTLAAPPRGWHGDDWGVNARDSFRDTAPRRDRSREGRVSVDRFVAEGQAAAALGHGRIAIAPAPGSDSSGLELAMFEAALVDQLARAGYDTATPDPAGGQIAEVTVTHDVVEPEEARRKPVSGAMTVGVSNRGSMVGMELNIDGTKPLKALVATRLQARIRDRVTGAALWEGRATILTRDGDERWSQQAIAAKLTAELFTGFPAAGA